LYFPINKKKYRACAHKQHQMPHAATNHSDITSEKHGFHQHVESTIFFAIIVTTPATIIPIKIKISSIWSRVKAAVFIHDVFQPHRRTWSSRLTDPYRTAATSRHQPDLHVRNDPC
jgi:hypothetical protein